MPLERPLSLLGTCSKLFSQMAVAAEIQRLCPDILIWQTYDSAVKADLFSTAIVSSTGVFIIDPVPLTESAFSRLANVGQAAAVIVTNSNHHRASAQFSERFSVPVFAHVKSFPQQKPLRFSEIADSDAVSDDLSVIAIDGAVDGEIAIHYRAGNGTLIVGDALINFEPCGFTFLPRMYCAKEKEMKQSLRKLLDLSAERILFAHGLPIMSKASARLRQLFDGES